MKELNEAMERIKKRIAAYKENPELAQHASEEKMGNPITLAPRVPPAEEWVDDMTTSAKAKSGKWLRRSLKPRKNPKERALVATGKYKEKLTKALEEGRWEKGIERYDLDIRQKVIEATGEDGFKKGIDRKKIKANAKIKELQPLVLAMAEEMDKMPVDTDEQREAKMLAARRGMIEIGRKMKGL